MFSNMKKVETRGKCKKPSNTSKVDASGAISLSWKHHHSTPSLFMNSKLALTADPDTNSSQLHWPGIFTKCCRLRLWIHLLLLLFAIATELVPSSHGQYLVAAPNGSPPVPRNVCQNATLNLIQSCGHNITIFPVRNNFESQTIQGIKKQHLHFPPKNFFISIVPFKCQWIFASRTLICKEGADKKRIERKRWTN